MDNPQCLREIFTALAEVSRDLPLVIPIHPRTRMKLAVAGIDTGKAPFARDKFCLIDPVGYLEMVYLLQRCRLVLTDSGGQKEACFYKRVIFQ